MDELYIDIPKIIKDALVKQLKVPRESKTYYGRKKPVGNNGTVYPKTPPIASGNLIRNIDVFWKDNIESNKPELVVEMPDYWIWVDQGRRPGRMPPLRVIDRWSIAKGLSGLRDEKGRFIPRKTLNYLRARSIGEYGYYKTDFVQKAINSVLNDVTEKLGEGAAQYVRELLDDTLKVYFQEIGIDIKL